jgi:hypothetical protein
MDSARFGRSLLMTGAVAALVLAGCGSPGGTVAQPSAKRSAGTPAVTPTASTTVPPVAATGNRSQGPAATRAAFSAPADVDNQMFPLAVGIQFVYRGRIVEDGRPVPHNVIFTVTDLTKMVDGVPVVVALDQDFLRGRLQEQELAFFAQDDSGNVWNFGEYPEEYEHGKFAGAPSTWIRGVRGTYGGIHMLAQPAVGAKYSEGLVPAIEFDDVSTVTSTSRKTCVRAGCFRQVLLVDETSPNDPASGHQLKYYAPGTGLIRVSARGGDPPEFLALTAVRHLNKAAAARVRAAALAMDRRAYRVTKVYRVTSPATPLTS